MSLSVCLILGGLLKIGSSRVNNDKTLDLYIRHVSKKGEIESANARMRNVCTVFVEVVLTLSFFFPSCPGVGTSLRVSGFFLSPFCLELSSWVFVTACERVFSLPRAVLVRVRHCVCFCSCLELSPWVFVTVCERVFFSPSCLELSPWVFVTACECAFHLT